MKINRIVEKEIVDLLKIFGAINIVGPKWCGKTWIGEKYSNSQYYLHNNFNNDILYLGQEKIILDGKYPRLIDEWQTIPELWDKIRFLVDHANGQKGLYILTGSTTLFDTNRINHSGAGRFAYVKMNTLTFSEIIDEKKQQKISLLDLFNQQKIIHVKNNYDIDWVTNQLIIGGWPEIIANKINNSNSLIKNYIRSLSNSELLNKISINKNSNYILNILKSIARLNATQIKNTNIIDDLNKNINERTLMKYFELFNHIFLVDYLDSWNINVRSKYKIRTTPKLYFCDPSIGLNLLSMTSKEKLLSDTNTLGIYFENQVIKDLKVYATSINASLYFYRDEKDFEVDAIMELEDGRWAPIEIKLSTFSIDETSKKLSKFKNRIEVMGNYKKPSFELIITNSDFSFQTKENVFVIPHTCLKP